MNTFETPAEFRAAFDALLAGTHRQLRIYDHDLGLLEIDHAPRHAFLRAKAWRFAPTRRRCAARSTSMTRAMRCC